MALLWGEFAAGQLFTVGEHDFANQAEGRTFSAGSNGDGNNLTWFKELRIPAGSPEDCGGQSFDVPIHRLPGIIFDVEKNLAMGAGPVVFGDGSFEGFEIFRVVIGGAVVGPELQAKDERADKQAKAQRQLRSHRMTPKVKALGRAGTMAVR